VPPRTVDQAQSSRSRCNCRIIEFALAVHVYVYTELRLSFLLLFTPFYSLTPTVRSAIHARHLPSIFFFLSSSLFLFFLFISFIYLFQAALYQARHTFSAPCLAAPFIFFSFPLSFFFFPYVIVCSAAPIRSPSISRHAEKALIRGFYH
jgi:hypothetical protein